MQFIFILATLRVTAICYHLIDAVLHAQCDKLVHACRQEVLSPCGLLLLTDFKVRTTGTYLWHWKAPHTSLPGGAGTVKHRLRTIPEAVECIIPSQALRGNPDNGSFANVQRFTSLHSLHSLGVV